MLLRASTPDGVGRRGCTGLQVEEVVERPEGETCHAGQQPCRSPPTSAGEMRYAQTPRYVQLFMLRWQGGAPRERLINVRVVQQVLEEVVEAVEVEERYVMPPYRRPPVVASHSFPSTPVRARRRPLPSAHHHCPFSAGGEVTKRCHERSRYCWQVMLTCCVGNRAVVAPGSGHCC